MAVAAALVFLIEKFYDPEARARAQAIEQEVTRMAEQQKVTDDLTRIEIDIEDAIMKNDLDDRTRRTRAAHRASRPIIRAANSCRRRSIVPQNCRS